VRVCFWAIAVICLLNGLVMSVACIAYGAPWFTWATAIVGVAVGLFLIATLATRKDNR
jgi:membrane associated rhomboid family serine protease